MWCFFLSFVALFLEGGGGGGGLVVAHSLQRQLWTAMATFFFKGEGGGVGKCWCCSRSYFLSRLIGSAMMDDPHSGG